MKLQDYGTLALIVAVLVFGGTYFSKPVQVQVSTPQQFGATGTEHTQTENFYSGLRVGTPSQITATGYSSLTGYNCATATWAPGAIAGVASTTLGTNATSTDITLPGAVVGDGCVGSFKWGGSTTSTGMTTPCVISGTATATLRMVNWTTTGFTPATSSNNAKVCLMH